MLLPDRMQRTGALKTMYDVALEENEEEEGICVAAAGFIFLASKL